MIYLSEWTFIFAYVQKYIFHCIFSPNSCLNTFPPPNTQFWFPPLSFSFFKQTHTSRKYRSQCVTRFCLPKRYRSCRVRINTNQILQTSIVIMIKSPWLPWDLTKITCPASSWGLPGPLQYVKIKEGKHKLETRSGFNNKQKWGVEPFPNSVKNEGVAALWSVGHSGNRFLILTCL